MKPEKPAAIMAEYNRLWSIEKRTPRGPDHDRITRVVAAQLDVTEDAVRNAVRADAAGLWG